MGRPRTRTDELRERIVAEAIAGHERDGDLALRARHVARAAGTSTAAVHELVGRHDDLVRAMIVEGYRRLDAMLAEVSPTDDADADVLALLGATRQFALGSPALHELMHRRPVTELLAGDQLDAPTSTYRRAVALARRWVAAVGSDIDPVDAARALVAANRGLIATEHAGQSGSDPTVAEARWRFALRAMMRGLATPDRGARA